MDPFAPRNYGMLRVRPRTSGFSTDEDELIELEFSSDSGIERDRAELNARHPVENDRTLQQSMGTPLIEKRKKRRKQNTDVIIKMQNKNFKVKARDSEIFEDDHHANEIDEHEIYELFKQEYKSAFTKIVTSTEYRNIIEPFLSITSEEQHVRLDGIDPPHAKHLAEDNSAASRFAHIERQVRVALRRQTGSLFIKQLEHELIDFIQNGPDKESTMDSSKLPLVLLFQDGYHRLMAHGVCQYYKLKSVSVSYSGERVTVISKMFKSNEPLALPPMFLYEYLRYLKEQEQNTFDDGDTTSSLSAAPFTKVHTRTFIHNYKREKAETTKTPPINNKITKPKRRKY